MKALLALAVIALVLMAHQLDWAESKCEELGNSAQECARLAE